MRLPPSVCQTRCFQAAGQTARQGTKKPQLTGRENAQKALKTDVYSDSTLDECSTLRVKQKQVIHPELR